jgi:hypothetical protein
LTRRSYAMLRWKCLMRPMMVCGCTILSLAPLSTQQGSHACFSVRVRRVEDPFPVLLIGDRAILLTTDGHPGRDSMQKNFRATRTERSVSGFICIITHLSFTFHITPSTSQCEHHGATSKAIPSKEGSCGCKIVLHRRYQPRDVPLHSAQSHV